jgi:hypothetical protein
MTTRRALLPTGTARAQPLGDEVFLRYGKA